MSSRFEVIELANSWLGKNEKDGSHKEIIDIYNSHSPLPRNYKMPYNASWCACTWSALAIKLGYTDIMPIEISCGFLIEEAKKMGIWQENDAYVPKQGDAILYDWDDNGKGDNTGWPDHVGVVELADEKSGYITVIEGNYKDSVKKRTISINGKYIRGFITPKYTVDMVTLPNKDNKDIKTLAMEAISGIWGDGTTRKKALENAGYDYAAVQSKIDEILNGSADKPTPIDPEPEKPIRSVKATCFAKGFDKKIAGEYRTTTDVYCRNDAGTNKKALCLIPSGTKVKNYGYYNTFSGSRWYLISFTVGGVYYEGFTHSKYLTR